MALPYNLYPWFRGTFQTTQLCTGKQIAPLLRQSLFFDQIKRQRLYKGIAIPSTTECAAILDIAQKLGLSETKKFNDARDLLFRIVSMLIRMVKSGT
jgi:hypothetical protein